MFVETSGVCVCVCENESGETNKTTVNSCTCILCTHQYIKGCQWNLSDLKTIGTGVLNSEAYSHVA